MKKEHEKCMSSHEAIDHYIKYRIMPLHRTDYINFKIRLLEKSDEHSEEYKKKRIELYKYLYCELAKSNILSEFSDNVLRMKYSNVTPTEEKEAQRIINEAKELLNETRDIEKYHLEGTHWMDNQEVISNYRDYLSAVYGIPVAIMTEQRTKSFWESVKFW
jgi:hypothetical protein